MQISVRKNDCLRNYRCVRYKTWHKIALCHAKINLDNSYMPVRKAIAAIIPRNNKIIPIATNVSCNSTELIFITYSLND
jgi:hypothetical protein